MQYDAMQQLVKQRANCKMCLIGCRMEKVIEFKTTVAEVEMCNLNFVSVN